MSTGTTVADLAGIVGGTVHGDGSVVCRDVHHDSRDVGAQSLFVAIVGYTGDGHDYVPAAIAAGASAVCVERPGAVAVPQIVVPSTRPVLGPLAAAVHGDPSNKLPVIGVTGTNGKTTVTHLLTSIIESAGLTAGLVGTVGARIAGRRLPLDRTTPEASTLQRLLAEMVESRVDAVAIEVSSHALELGRVDAVHFAVAAFTNLSQDHLDFHGDMESYFAAKRRLFETHRTGRAVISTADAWGRRLSDELTIPVTTAGIDGGDVTVRGLEMSLEGATFDLILGDRALPVVFPLPGRFNVENALVAAACADLAGIEPDAIVAGLSAPIDIPGRFERVEVDAPFAIIVDYAHTPQAIERIVEDVRSTADGKVIVVVGAGGDRDQAKRPAMGEAAATADVAIITSDNPRSEDPADIVAAVATGAGSAAITIVDRSEAIEHAVGLAGPGDVVLVLGKGHEMSQEIGGARIPFDDREIARLAALEATDG